MSGPLTGVRVLDLTSFLLGPFATQIMGDLGADVIKVESLDGDVLRHVGVSRSPGMSATFLNLNRNKRSMALDLKQPEAREALLKVAETADVFIHNMRPQAVKRLGLAYDDVRAINPRVVYCAAYGYRQDGPYGHKPAYDDMVQGACGIAGLIGRIEGEPGFVPTAFIDKTVGMTAAYAVLAALFHRERTGEGQAIDVPMFESIVHFLMIEHLYGLTFDPPLGRSGYPRMLVPHHKPYRTRDGHICILPYTDRQWERFFELAGHPEHMQDPRFVSLSKRNENVDDLYKLVGELAPARTTAEWIHVLDEAEIPAMPVIDPDDLPEDPHLKATGFFSLTEHPTEGSIRSMAFPVGLSRANGAILRRHAPRLGQHGREVLAEAGVSGDDIERLVGAGAVVEGAA